MELGVDHPKCDACPNAIGNGLTVPASLRAEPRRNPVSGSKADETEEPQVNFRSQDPAQCQVTDVLAPDVLIGCSAALPEGMRLDAQIAVQSPATWTSNTHFMIADTDAGKNVGVGFINTDFLISVDNAFLELNSSGIRLAVLPLNATPGLLQNTVAAGDFSWRLKTTFGGGYMTNLGDASAIKGFGLDLFLHADKLDLTFSPPTGGTYIGFNWDANLLGDSYIRLTEPGSSAAFTIDALSGPLSVHNGKIDLRAGGESADGKSRLAFEQELKAGRTASGVSTDVLMGQLAIGANNIARLAVPGGIWYGGLALKEQ